MPHPRRIQRILRSQFAVACAALLVERGRVLLVRETKEHVRGLYNFPAGGEEPNETVQQGTKRECFEETGLRVKPVELIGIYERARTQLGSHLVIFVFRVRRLSGRIRTSRQHPEVRFFTISEVRRLARQGRLRNSYIIHSINDWQRGQRVGPDFVRPIGD